MWLKINYEVANLDLFIQVITERIHDRPAIDLRGTLGNCLVQSSLNFVIRTSHRQEAEGVKYVKYGE